MSQKRVCLIIVTADSALTDFQPIKAVPEIALLAKTEVSSFIYETNQPAGDQWQKLVELVKTKATEKYSGLVVLTDLSLLLPLANAVSFGWLKPTLPIIFTIGLEDLVAGKSGKQLINGAKANLINALEVAVSAKPQTVVLSDQYLLSPAQAEFDRQHQVRAATGKYLGKIDFGLSFSESILPTKQAWPNANQFATNIQIVDLTLDNNYQPNLKAQGVIFINRGNSDNLQVAWPKDLPWVVFQTGPKPRHSTLPIVNYLTWDCLLVKFAWLLAASSDQDKIMAALADSYVGEIISA